MNQFRTSVEEYKRIADLGYENEDTPENNKGQIYSLIEDIWLRNTLNIPKWFRASRDIVLVSPSSCAIGPASPFSFDIDSLHSQGFSDSQAAAVRFVIIVIFVCLLIINFSYEILKGKKLKLSIFELVQLLVI